MQLTAQNVYNTFMECLFNDGEDTSDHIISEGVTLKVGFHPARLNAKKQSIETMLSELPAPFFKETGGGWSFLNACQTKTGNQWCDAHRTIDQLVCLGIAIGKVQFLAPRELWAALPGGMPYFVVNL